MKELSDKEIDRLSELIVNIAEYKYEKFDKWSDFTEAKGLYIIRHEILAMYKLYEELGITIDFNKMCALDITDEDWYGEEECQEYQSIMQNMVFPPEKVMKENGWQETDIYIDVDELELSSEDDEGDEREDIGEGKNLDSVYKNVFGEFADVLVKPKEFLDFVIQGDFWSNGSWTMKNIRAGLYMDYVNNHPELRTTKRHKQIMMCLETITQPFIFHYSFDEMVIKNQCLYAFTAAGSFECGEGEFIDAIHGKTTRYLCVELLSLLLDKAEKKYHYMKAVRV